MANFHITPLGSPGRCTAKPGNCPFGSDLPHYQRPEDARAAYEQSEKHALVFAPIEDEVFTSDEERQFEHLAALWEVAEARHRNAEVARREADSGRVELEDARENAAGLHARRRANANLIQGFEVLDEAEADRAHWASKMAEIDEQASQLRLAAANRASSLSKTEKTIERLKVQLEGARERLAAEAKANKNAELYIRKAREEGRTVAEAVLTTYDASERSLAEAAGIVNDLEARLETYEKSQALWSGEAQRPKLSAETATQMALRELKGSTSHAIVAAKDVPEGSVELQMANVSLAREVAEKFSKRGWVVEQTGVRRIGEKVRVHDPAETSLPIRSSSDFNWHKDSDTYTIEASELGGPIEEQFLLTPRKGHLAARVHLDSVDQDAEGEYRSWTFKPQDNRHSWKVTVFND